VLLGLQQLEAYSCPKVLFIVNDDDNHGKSVL
jgi:hypothetical protein